MLEQHQTQYKLYLSTLKQPFHQIFFPFQPRQEQDANTSFARPGPLPALLPLDLRFPAASV